LGSIFIWLYAIIGVPLGKIADSRSRKKLLAGGMMVWTALTAVAALASSYTMLLLSRLGFAVGEAAVAPAATSWIGDLFPPARRSRPLALFMLGVPCRWRGQLFPQRTELHRPLAGVSPW
jgi:predicted MFS family arabinose efflux permease